MPCIKRFIKISRQKIRRNFSRHLIFDAQIISRVDKQRLHLGFVKLDGNNKGCVQSVPRTKADGAGEPGRVKSDQWCNTEKNFWLLFIVHQVLLTSLSLCPLIKIFAVTDGVDHVIASPHPLCTCFICQFVVVHFFCLLRLMLVAKCKLGDVDYFSNSTFQIFVNS